MPDPVLTDHQISERLAANLPRWTHEDGHLKRRYPTHGWKSALMVVNAIGHLAELAFHHPDIELGFPGVTVKLMTHDAGGITEKDFALAVEIERLVTWRPAPGGPLEGIPDDPRYRYLKD